MELLLSIFLFSWFSFCEDFFVDINSYGGSCLDDSQTHGTINSPFCSLSYSVGQLSPGDTLFIRAGTYDERLRVQLEVFGTESQRITIQNYNSEYVLVTGGVENYISVSVFGSYITIIGLNLKVDLTGIHDSFRTVDLRGHHNELKKCNVWQDLTPVQQRDSNIRIAGIVIDAGNYNIVEECTVKNMRTGIAVTRNGNNIPTFNIVRKNIVSSIWGNCFEITSTLDQISGNIIEENLCEGSVISDGVQSNANFDLRDSDPTAFSLDISAQGYIIRRNIFRYFGENCIDIKGSSHFVIEENICYGGNGNNDGYYEDYENDRNGGVGGFMHGSGQSSKQVIIRNNILYDNRGGISIYEDWVAYNNIIYTNNRDFTGPNSVFDEPGAYFVGITANQVGGAIKNNVIAHHADFDMQYKVKGGLFSYDSDYNLYYNTRVDQNFLLKGSGTSDYYNFEDWKDYSLTQNQIYGKEKNSIFADPQFVNAPSNAFGDHRKYDFSYSTSSPCINAGGPLTITLGSGSGTTINVNDATYFFDGYGIENEGDLIIVGSNNAVKINNVDYSNNIIEVDSSISWNDGDWINLPFEGTSADIGNSVWNDFFVTQFIHWNVEDYGLNIDWIVILTVSSSLFLVFCIVIFFVVGLILFFGCLTFKGKNEKKISKI